MLGTSFYEMTPGTAIGYSPLPTRELCDVRYLPTMSGTDLALMLLPVSTMAGSNARTGYYPTTIRFGHTAHRTAIRYGSTVIHYGSTVHRTIIRDGITVHRRTAII